MRYLALQQGAAKVLRLTQNMLVSARSEDWQTVADLEQDRQLAIDSLFAHPDMPGTLHLLADTLQQVVNMDRECIQLGTHHRSRMAKQLKIPQQGDKAVTAYRDCSSALEK